MISTVRASLTLVALLAAPTWPVCAQERVDVELVLAVDVSRSMEIDELRQQREGYVAAFRSPDVIGAIERGAYGRVAVTYVEWARADLKKVIVPWTIIDGPVAAYEFAARLDAAEVANMQRTSISGAIRYSANALQNNAISGFRRVIDISGDGANNQGGPVTKARDMAVARGITINGLPLMVEPWTGAVYGNSIGLDAYYIECVAGGPGSFVLPIRKWEEFPEAVRRKLVLELSGLPPAELPVVPVQFSPGDDAGCSLGED